VSATPHAALGRALQPGDTRMRLSAAASQPLFRAIQRCPCTGPGQPEAPLAGTDAQQGSRGSGSGGQGTGAARRSTSLAPLTSTSSQSSLASACSKSGADPTLRGRPDPTFRRCGPRRSKLPARPSLFGADELRRCGGLARCVEKSW
jgi:hypothetical protein